jgi:hypothetical protein
MIGSLSAPRISFSDIVESLRVVFQGGFNMRPDDGEIPFSVWGSLNRSVGGWNLKAKVDADSKDLNSVDFDVRAEGGPTSLQLRASGNVDAKSKSGQVTEVGLTQAFGAPGGELSLSPSYNYETRKAQVRVEYGLDGNNTRITVNADSDRQKVTVARRINADHSIAPSITSDGDVELEYRCRVVGDGVCTANYRPNDATCLEYEAGPWVASAIVPMDGFYKISNAGTKFAIRRSIPIEAS